jgi:CRP-like cAMP-binding protein
MIQFGGYMAFSEKDLKQIFESRLFLGTNRERALQVFEENDCRVIEYSDGDVLHEPSCMKKSAGLILAGKATVSTPDPSKKTLLRYLEAGSLYGIANLFSDAPYVSVIRAHGDCRVFSIPESAVRRLLSEDSTFLYQYLAFLSDRIRFLNRKIGYLTAGSAERRLALYLNSLGTSTVKLDVSISALSELLDVGRASLYRAFDKLTEDGYLRKDGRSFTLLDPNGMLKAYQ